MIRARHHPGELGERVLRLNEMEGSRPTLHRGIGRHVETETADLFPWSPSGDRAVLCPPRGGDIARVYRGRRLL